MPPRHRFTFLLAVLLVAIAGHGFLGTLPGGANPLEWLLGVSLVAAVFSVPPGRLRWLLTGLVAACVAARLTQGLVGHPLPGLVSQGLVAVATLLAAGVAVQRALASGPVDFVTQATVGFGDIVPVGERAEGLVVVQGVGGQMYLAVLVARLVSLYSAQEKA